MRKFWVPLVVGGVGSAIVIWADVKVVQWMFAKVPASEWAGLVKVIIVFFDVWLTAGICLLPILGGMSLGAYLYENRRVL